MRFVDFFAGVGGISLGLERAGHECVGQVEIDEFCLRVLAKHWPEIERWKDLKDVCRMLNCGRLVFPAKTYRTLASAPACPGSAQDCSGTSCAPFAWFDQSTFSWRTWQLSFIEGYALYSERWPKAGMIRNGIAYRRQPLVRRISAIGFSFWRTPQAADTKQKPQPPRLKQDRQTRGVTVGSYRVDLADQVAEPSMWPTPRANENCQYNSQDKGVALSRAVKMWPTPQASEAAHGGPNARDSGGAPHLSSLAAQSEQTSGQLNPMWVEGLMGFPFGFTDIAERE